MRAFTWVMLLVLPAVSVATSSCTREDGLPDPPPQMLVPSNPSASADSPLACQPDAAVALDAGVD